MKTRTFACFGACMVFAVFAVPACTADTGAAGKVFDLATGTGVEGVTVVASCTVNFEKDRPYARVETMTAADGTYTLNGLLPDREYGLSFAKIGYIVESRWVTRTAVGKTSSVSAIALCPIPATHGVYRLTNETVQFLQRFARPVGSFMGGDPSARPEHPLTYTPLPQATYKEIPVPGKKDEFMDEITVSRETVIPQILHKHERTQGEMLMVLFERNERAPTVWPISEDGTTSENRRFIAGSEGTLTKPAFEIQLVNARCFVVYSGILLTGEGHLCLCSGFSVFFVRSGGNILAFLFEVVDTVSGDNVTRCRNILTIMRHEIAAFREQNGRWPTYEEFNMGYDGHPLVWGVNPFCGYLLSKDADTLGLKKGATYVEPLREDGGEVRPIGWLYSPSTGEVWAATSSGNEEASW